MKNHGYSGVARRFRRFLKKPQLSTHCLRGKLVFAGAENGRPTSTSPAKICTLQSQTVVRSIGGTKKY